MFISTDTIGMLVISFHVLTEIYDKAINQKEGIPKNCPDWMLPTRAYSYPPIGHI